VGVLRPYHSPLLPLPFRLRFAELPLEGLYRRGHPRLPFPTKTHMVVGILQHPVSPWTNIAPGSPRG
jgi:hypothetical protein